VRFVCLNQARRLVLVLVCCGLREGECFFSLLQFIDVVVGWLVGFLLRVCVRDVRAVRCACVGACVCVCRALWWYTESLRGQEEKNSPADNRTNSDLSTETDG
jgi:hypothetical protein